MSEKKMLVERDVFVGSDEVEDDEEYEQVAVAKSKLELDDDWDEKNQVIHCHRNLDNEFDDRRRYTIVKAIANSCGACPMC